MLIAQSTTSKGDHTMRPTSAEGGGSASTRERASEQLNLLSAIGW